LNLREFSQRNQTGLVVLGSNGFLGRNLTVSLLKNYSFRDQIFISQKNSTGKIRIIEFYSLDEWPIAKLLDQFEKLVIVNLLSGKMQSKKESIETHYSLPKFVFDEASKKTKNKIHWVQIESYSQYSTDLPHDINYVEGKNLFHRYLIESSSINTTLEFIVLGHLYGPGDPKERFLPLTFRKILNNEEIVIRNSDEQIPLVDVRDVADFLAIKLGKIDQLKSDNYVGSFPIVELPTIFQVFQKVKEISGSESKFHEAREFNARFIERYLSEEQPKVINVSFGLRTFHNSITDTIHDMKFRNNK
jgi:nucleoside-diphosphate-sugar epimerase